VEVMKMILEHKKIPKNKKAMGENPWPSFSSGFKRLWRLPKNGLRSSDPIPQI
jgi:hypothetical protein